MFEQVVNIESPAEVQAKLFMRPFQGGFTLSRGMRTLLEPYLFRGPQPHSGYSPRQGYIATILFCTLHLDLDTKQLKLVFQQNPKGLNVFKLRVRHSIHSQSVLQIPGKTLQGLLDSTSRDRFYLVEHVPATPTTLQHLTFSYAPKESILND